VTRAPSTGGRCLPLACALAALALIGCASVGEASARAESTWRLEQPAAPAPPAGVAPAAGPVGLGRVGDIKFFAPNLGVLTTAGDPPTVAAGIWIYNGQDWRELANKCGAHDGHIAWAGDTEPEPGHEDAEFWTVAEGRPGQAAVNGKVPELSENTLCRFADGKIVESFAAPANEANSYEPMHAAACLGADDCWFAGESLPPENPEVGAFQLNWDGAALGASPYRGEGHTVFELESFDGKLYASVRLLKACPPGGGAKCDPVAHAQPNPPALHVLDPEAADAWEPETRLGRSTLYAEGESFSSLDYLHLSSGTNSLWAAAGPRVLAGSTEQKEAQVTVLRFTPEAGGQWHQLLGSKSTPHTGAEAFPASTVRAIAAEPNPSEEEEEHAWVALQTLEEAEDTESAFEQDNEPPASFASVDRISSAGALEGVETLPSATTEPGVGPKGAAEKLVCPAPGDCWMVTTQGWLFHLAPEGERTLSERNGGFSGLITERPADLGLPQTLPDAVPAEESEQLGEAFEPPKPLLVNKGPEEARIPLPLLSRLRSRVVHGSTLELRFHVAVEARLQLIAKRKRRVVAESPKYTFKAGEHKILLRLNPKRWPTELHLNEHPLAPLPTVSANAGVSETVTTTSLAFPSRLSTNGIGLP
jgi:hypothetical protein